MSENTIHWTIRNPTQLIYYISFCAESSMDFQIEKIKYRWE
nr:MAG TPA: hypothetical protein [Caudoviricetes sp.]